MDIPDPQHCLKEFKFLGEWWTAAVWKYQRHDILPPHPHQFHLSILYITGTIRFVCHQPFSLKCRIRYRFLSANAAKLCVSKNFEKKHKVIRNKVIARRSYILSWIVLSRIDLFVSILILYIFYLHKWIVLAKRDNKKIVLLILFGFFPFCYVQILANPEEIYVQITPSIIPIVLPG